MQLNLTVSKSNDVSFARRPGFGSDEFVNTGWGNVIVDPRQLAESTGRPSGYLNVVTDEGWVIQLYMVNWHVHIVNRVVFVAQRASTS